MQRLTVTAYGKINLALDIIGRRPDGYHLVQMVMHQVKLGDTIILTKRPSAVTLDMRPPCPQIPPLQNMTWRAFHLMQQHYGLSGGLHMEIEKRLPIAAGLAGGSANAAAVMLGVNQLWGLEAPLAELQQLGLTLGADVPYCLAGGAMLAEGIGEQLTPLDTPPPLWVVLANPGFPVDTGEIFRNFDLAHKGPAPDIPGMRQALALGSVEQLIACQNNVLESVTLKRYPQVAKLKQDMLACGLPAMMSGSGGTVLGLTQHQQQGQEAVRWLDQRYPWAVLTKLLVD